MWDENERDMAEKTVGSMGTNGDGGSNGTLDGSWMDMDRDGQSSTELRGSGVERMGLPTENRPRIVLL